MDIGSGRWRNERRQQLLGRRGGVWIVIEDGRYGSTDGSNNAFGRRWLSCRDRDCQRRDDNKRLGQCHSSCRCWDGMVGT